MSKSEKRQVLIIERAPSLKTYYSNAIIKMNLEPVVVNNGADALQFLNGSIDGELVLMVMDWILQDMHGYIVAQRVKQDPRFSHVDFLICTSEFTEEDKMLLQELDISNVLPKGASMQQILDRTKEALDQGVKLPKATKMQRDLEDYLSAGNVSEAIKLSDSADFKKTLAKETKYKYLLGEIEIAKKRYGEALSLLQDQVDSFTRNAENNEGTNHTTLESNPFKSVNTYAKSLCMLGRFKDAEPLYRKLFKNSPKNLAHIVRMAEAQLGQNKSAEAKDNFAVVLRQDPGHPQAHVGLGKAAIMEGDLETAKEHFKQAGSSAILASPTFASFFNNRAVTLIHDNRVEEAIELYENSLQFIVKERHSVQFNLGMAYLRLRRCEEAVTLFEGVLGTAPQEFICKKTILLRLRNEGREDFIRSYEGAASASKPEDSAA
jgi:tetratricopeptide (TPR) repeat protein